MTGGRERAKGHANNTITKRKSSERTENHAQERGEKLGLDAEFNCICSQEMDGDKVTQPFTKRKKWKKKTQNIVMKYNSKYFITYSYSVARQIHERDYILS